MRCKVTELRFRDVPLHASVALWTGDGPIRALAAFLHYAGPGTSAWRDGEFVFGDTGALECVPEWDVEQKTHVWADAQFFERDDDGCLNFIVPVPWPTSRVRS